MTTMADTDYEFQQLCCWNCGTVPAIVRRIVDEQAWYDLSILADALEDAGCSNQEALSVLRNPEEDFWTRYLQWHQVYQPIRKKEKNWELRLLLFLATDQEEGMWPIPVIKSTTLKAVITAYRHFE